MSLWNSFSRLSRSVRARLREHQGKIFTKYLLITNLTISTTFSGLGDVLEQTYEISAGHEDSWDRRRTLKLASAGLPIGFLCHHWYLFLDRYIPGRRGKPLIKKFLLDQLIGSPMYITVFFITLSIWNRSSFQEFKHELFTKGGEVYRLEWFVWPPAQLINFYFLPTKFRLLYESTISLGFDTYFSYITYKDKKEKKKTLETARNE